MTFRDAVLRELERQPLTAAGLADRLAHSLAATRDMLARLFFSDRSVLCDANGRYHLRGGRTLNGVVAVGAEYHPGGGR
jgi:hypothetical protein